jgi:hypothetical protein
MRAATLFNTQSARLLSVTELGGMRSTWLWCRP